MGPDARGKQAKRENLRGWRRDPKKGSEERIQKPYVRPDAESCKRGLSAGRMPSIKEEPREKGSDQPDLRVRKGGTGKTVRE